MFEVSTAIAIVYYANMCRPEFVVWETGLGGRMDVTNIVTPIISLITNIGMDHTDVLGDTIELIATEKAGIIKAGVPVVSCVTQPEAGEVIKSKAKVQNADLYLWKEQFSYDRISLNEISQRVNFQGLFEDITVDIGLQGEHQCTNASGVLMVLEVLREQLGYDLSNDKIARGMWDTMWAGRMELIHTEPRIVLDGAHNPEGAESLARSLPETYKYRKLNLMMGILANKHHRAYLQHILPIVDTLILSEPDFRRKLDAASLYEIVTELQEQYAKPGLKIIVEPNWKKALLLLLSQTQQEDLGVVTGTLYMISDVRANLLHQTDSEKGW
ncbi:Folylpolyglutamate synthase [compost metagenome]